MSAERPLLPDELPAEAHTGTQTFYEETANGHHAGDAPASSTKVGWTLRDSSNRILDGFAFLINPQGLTRTEGTRSQVFSTKGGHYVDSFGPAPGVIQLRQLVARGKTLPGDTFYTAREDIQRWLKTIYLPATQGPQRTHRRVFFHDHHLERGFEQRVQFPDSALTIERSVDLHNVWRFDLQMISLEKYPYDEVVVEHEPTPTQVGRQHVVRPHETLHGLSVQLAGPGASRQKIERVRGRILDLNPFLTKARTLADGRTAKPLILHAGEILTLPR